MTFNATATVNGLGQTVVTLDTFTGATTESGSLTDGRYTLTVLANQVSAGGTNMASNFVFGDPQGLFRFRPASLPGQGNAQAGEQARVCRIQGQGLTETRRRLHKVPPSLAHLREA